MLVSKLAKYPSVTCKCKLTNVLPSQVSQQDARIARRTNEDVREISYDGVLAVAYSRHVIMSLEEVVVVVIL